MEKMKIRPQCKTAGAKTDSYETLHTFVFVIHLTRPTPSHHFYVFTVHAGEAETMINVSNMVIGIAYIVVSVRERVESDVSDSHEKNMLVLALNEPFLSQEVQYRTCQYRYSMVMYEGSKGRSVRTCCGVCH